MSPSIRTPQQRDRRFARVRRLTQTVFVGSGLLSALAVAFVAANAVPVTKTPVTVPVTTTPTTVPTTSSGGSTASTAYVPPTTAPVTSTTVCYSTPSGHVTCY